MSRFHRRRVPRTPRIREGNWRSVADAIRVVAERQSDAGLVVNSMESLVQALSYSGGGSNPEPLRIILGEGTWMVDDAGITIARSDLHFVAQGRGTARFLREVASSRNMLLFTGDRIVLDGLYFEDQNGTDAAIELRGDDCVVRNCWFEDCAFALENNGGDRCTFDNNEVKAVTHASYGILLTGTSERNRVTNNRFHKSTGGITQFIYAGDSVTESLFVGNMWLGGDRVMSYKGSSQNQGDATMNIGSVDVRP